MSLAAQTEAAAPGASWANSAAQAAKFRGLRIFSQFSILGAKENVQTSLTRRSVKPSSPVATAEVPNWSAAASAAESRKATDLRILDLREVTSFTDFFVVCTVSNPRQGHAVCDEIHKQLKEIGELPVSIEGYDPAEWILMDYGDFVVHIFSEHARGFYDLERLWRHAKIVDFTPTVPVTPSR